jgi:hypothetical protein
MALRPAFSKTQCRREHEAKQADCESDGRDQFFCGGGRSGKVRAVRRPKRGSPERSALELAGSFHDRANARHLPPKAFELLNIGRPVFRAH